MVLQGRRASAGRSVRGLVLGGVLGGKRCQRGFVLDRAHAAVRWFLRQFVLVPDDYVPWARLATRECLRLCSERRIDAIYTTLPPFSSARARSPA